MKKIITLMIALLLSVPSAQAKVNTAAFPATILESSVLVVRGNNLHNNNNPFTVKLITLDGAVINLPSAPVNKKRAEVLIPAIPAAIDGSIKVILSVSGGNVAEASAENFPIFITKRPSNLASDLDSNQIASLPILPDNIPSGLAPGPQGPEGPEGGVGQQGPPGPTGTMPATFPGGSITGTVAQANQVVQASQNAITTLNNLTSFGNSVATTNVGSVLSVPSGVTANLTGNVTGDLIGNVTGNVTGNLTGNVTGDVLGNVTGNLTGQVLTATQNNITALPALVTAGTTLVNTTFAGPVVGAEGFQGNLTGTVLTATQNDITTMTGLINAGTAGTNTTFAGPVVGAEGFQGNLTGTVLTATQNDITTMAGLISAGTTGVTTNFLGPINAVEGFTGPVTGALTGDVTGNLTGQVSTATQSTIANLPALVTAGTAGINTSFAGPVVGAQGFQGDLTGQVVTPVQTGITDLPNLAFVGAVGNNVQFRGTVQSTGGFIGSLSGHASTATTANEATTVLGAQQTAITSLPNLVNIGKTATNTTMLGPVVAPEGFIGNLNGNVLGSAASAVKLKNGATELSIAGGHLATLTTNGNVSLTLPSAPGELALRSQVTAVQAQVTTNTTDIATNAAAIVTNTAAIATNTADITDLANDIVALEANNNANGVALQSLSLTDATQTAAITVEGTDEVKLITVGNVDLTLPSQNGTLALVGASSLPSVAPSVFDINVDGINPVAGQTELDVSGFDFIKVSSSGGPNQLAGFTGGVEGKILTIYFINNVDVISAASSSATERIQTQGGGTILANQDDVLVVVYTSGRWYQVSFSAN
jgi:hypothetical protein